MATNHATKSMAARGNELSDTFFQLKVLNGKERSDAKFEPFAKAAARAGFHPLTANKIDIFQVNIGKMCNQVCGHCHVDAGPDRKEIMTKDTLQQCLNILAKTDISTVDITGGAPEMNPNFRWFVEECTRMGKKVINRCNLTIIMANKKYKDLPQFFAQHGVHIVSSLPYFSKVRTDAQRGDGVFEDSIAALKLLNEVGYGKEGSGLLLDLVYNPSGAFLPAAQAGLEKDFKTQLKRRFDVVFNQLYAITNMPISRYMDYLLESNNYESYMELLVNAFNPAAVSGVMCRNTISVSWDGYLYDCDFNQMLDLPVKTDGVHQPHLNDFDTAWLEGREIILNQHCYGCTAGAGSSCGGEIAT
ncbi:MAG: hypothetical protein RL757_2759 [Bacteroidota bacterium]|jgi:radical SAM/Cys-rich protein